MNILATAIAIVIVIGACIVIGIPCAFIAYETRRFYLFLRRAYSCRRLNAIMDDLKPMDAMLKEASR